MSPRAQRAWAAAVALLLCATATAALVAAAQGPAAAPVRLAWEMLGALESAYPEGHPKLAQLRQRLLELDP